MKKNYQIELKAQSAEVLYVLIVEHSFSRWYLTELPQQDWIDSGLWTTSAASISRAEIDQ